IDGATSGTTTRSAGLSSSFRRPVGVISSRSPPTRRLMLPSPAAISPCAPSRRPAATIASRSRDSSAGRAGERDGIAPHAIDCGSGCDPQGLECRLVQLQDHATRLAVHAVAQLLDHGGGSAAGHLDFDHARRLDPRRATLSVTMPGMPRVSLDMPAVEVTDLRKRYGHVEALAGLTMTVGGGEVFGFLGPNGAGKTTTVKLLL